MISDMPHPSPYTEVRVVAEADRDSALHMAYRAPRMLALKLLQRREVDVAHPTLAESLSRLSVHDPGLLDLVDDAKQLDAFRDDNVTVYRGELTDTQVESYINSAERIWDRLTSFEEVTGS